CLRVSVVKDPALLRVLCGKTRNLKLLLQPDVALTDYFLTAECALFVWLLSRRRPHASHTNDFVLFFAATGTAALLGGTVHGFFPDQPSVGAEAFWRLSLVVVGIIAFSLWSLWSDLFFSTKAAKIIRILAAVELLLFALYVLPETRPFRVAIADYLPPVIILMLSWCRLYARQPNRRVLGAALGLTLALLPSYLQQRHVGIHPLYFNHN